MFYVIAIDEKGTPGNLAGPASWEDCISSIMQSLEEVPLTQEDIDSIDYGEYQSSEGMSYFIIQTEEIS